VKIDSSQTCASLTTGSNSCEDSSLEGDLKVGVWHDDCSVVATKFEDGLSEASMNIGADTTADISRASEGDERNSGVLNHSISDIWSITSADSHNTVEAVCLEDVTDDFTCSNCHKRDSLSSFPDDLISANKSERCVPSHDGDWEVKCCNHTNISNWVPDLHHEMRWSLRVEYFTINGS